MSSDSSDVFQRETADERSNTVEEAECCLEYVSPTFFWRGCLVLGVGWNRNHVPKGDLSQLPPLVLNPLLSLLDVNHCNISDVPFHVRLFPEAFRER